MKIIVALLFFAGVPARAAEDCAALATGKDVIAEPRTAFQENVEHVDRCPQVERVWYLALRVAELGGGVFPAQLAGSTVADVRTAADKAVERFPKSARLATLRARLLGTADAAQAAIKLDANWTPAKVALASAYVGTSDFNTAARTLSGAGDLSRIPGAATLLGRAKLMSGDFEGALVALAGELPTDAPLEPTTPAFLQRVARDKQEWTGLASLAAGKTDQAMVALVSAATDGGELAIKQLRSADPPIKKALAALAKDKRLDARQRTWLRGFLAKK
jgi:hypothetical protein